MHVTRRKFVARSMLRIGGLAGLASCVTGCVPQIGSERLPEAVWGRRGLSDGRLMKPRAMIASPDDELYVVDMTGRIQVFSLDGEFQRGWRTPLIKQGKPTGMGWGNQGELLVADTHYFRVLIYSPNGQLDESRSIGGENGDLPGQFHFVTDVAQDSRGHFFVGQYGQVDQIQEFGAEGNFIRRWGSQGSRVGQFSRPQALHVDDQGLLWVADACNHRMQIFDVAGAEPKLVDCWGVAGANPGQLQYPYGIVFDSDGTLLISEYGNHRIQRFSRTGESLECWGTPGTEPGQFMSPWSLALDSKRNLHVLDTLNHRMQRFNLKQA